MDVRSVAISQVRTLVLSVANQDAYNIIRVKANLVLAEGVGRYI